MALALGDMQGIGTRGWWLTAPSVPATPTLAVTDDGTGTSVTAAVTGAAGATHLLLYRTAGDTAWTEGESRAGDGDIAQTGLTAGTYQFIVQSASVGVYSRPSPLVAVTLTDAAAPSASGPAALPLEHLRTLLSNSTNFQTWVGEATAEDAKAHIYRVAVDPPYAAKRPFACVRHHNPAELEHESISGGAGNTYVERGTLQLYFEAGVAAGHQASHADAELQFLNDVGSFLSDMEALSGTGTYLNVTGWYFLAGPQRASEDESQSEGDYMQCLVRIDWGI